MNETEHTCQFCYYEYFDSRAYPCSMCVCGEQRKDMFQPKGRQNKRKIRTSDVDVDDIGDCVICKHVGTDKCDDCYCGTKWEKRADYLRK